MADAEVLVFRAALGPKVYRDFEIGDGATLHDLAEAIVQSFDFDLDHAFGFYNKLKGNLFDSAVRYELFADMGEGETDAKGVERTPIAEAFPAVGAKMRFLFDYGDNWEFLIALVARKPRPPRVRLPRVLLSVGAAPEQYPDAGDE
jgi:Plasmid pRiA4b ORF-3-like protein